MIMVVARAFCVVAMWIITGPIKGAHWFLNITFSVTSQWDEKIVFKTSLIWAIVIQRTRLLMKVWRNFWKSCLCWVTVTVCITHGLANRSLHGVTRLLLTNSATMAIILNKLDFQQVKNKRAWTEKEGLFVCGFGEPQTSAGKHY